MNLQHANEILANTSERTKREREKKNKEKENENSNIVRKLESVGKSGGRLDKSFMQRSEIIRGRFYWRSLIGPIDRL